MCMEDIRIGRRKQYAASTLSGPNATWTPAAGQSESRVAISFATLDNSSFYVTPLGNPGEPLKGYLVNPVNSPLTFDIETYGNLVTGRWSYTTAGVAMSISVTEVFLQER